MNPVSPLVHIVDDDAAVLTALSLLIGSVGLRVATWTHPEAFLAGFDRESVGVILLDVRMPGLSGPTVLDRLRSEGVDQPVIILTGHGTVETCRRVFKAGAVEFFEKPVDDEPLLEAIHNAVRTHVQSRERLSTDRDARERFATLSERECEVACLAVEGLTNKEIGRALGVSPRTVETHRAHLSDKLQAKSLAQLIRRYGALVDELSRP